MSKATEYCNSVFDGTHDSPKPCKTGHKLLTSKNIMNGYIDKTDSYYISDEDYDSINKRSQVKQWDILFSMIGTVGNVCIITDKDIDFAIKNMGVFSCKNEYEAKWLYFYLQSDYVKKVIQNYLNGAVQKFLPLGKLRDFEIPDFDESKKHIVDLLWNIETKIRNNEKVISELESMAKTIYDYWFLQYEFPNEEGKPYKSSGGKMIWNEELKKQIPEGFLVEKILNCCDVVDCLHSKKPDYCFEDEKYYLLTLENLKYDGNIELLNKFYISKIDYENWTSRIEVKENDFVVTNAGRAGDICKIPKDIKCAIGRNITAIRPKTINPYYLRQFFKSNYIKQQIQSNLDCGSFFMSFNVKSIKQILILKPNEKIYNIFNEKIEKYILKIEKCVKENEELTKLRDYLLPLLMNGQVSFKN